MGSAAVRGRECRMRGTKKAPASAATLTGAVENGSVCETAQPSTKDSIISAGDSQTFRVADLLLVGEEHALPMKHLRSVTGRPSRELRAMIQRERLEGTPICANNRSGYFLPETDQERSRCVKSMRHRASEILKSAAAIEQGGDGV